ncbi:MAG TPA: exosortase/archaeosortase family protein, partial [Nitrososphaerales archaeon]|nr:exosortase/archaeosortase family protein [Nitrososphaerales archaeon]
WDDFHRVLLTEGGVRSNLRVRFAGAGLAAVPALLWPVSGLGGSPGYLSMEVAAASLVVAAYGTLVAVNPTMWKVMLPYAALYGVGVLTPLLMLDYLGGPLASLSSSLASAMTSAMGVSVAWQGVSFAFVSAGGEPISAVVSPVCSAAYSISIYLALLGLMHLDMGASRSTTLKFALAGVGAILLVNSARISLTILFGFLGGSSAFWGVHDWLGYAMFFAFYLGVLVTYSRATRTSAALPPRA